MYDISTAERKVDGLLYSDPWTIGEVLELMETGPQFPNSTGPEAMRSPGAPAGIIPGAETIGAWPQANRVQVDPYVESPILTRFWEQRRLPVEWNYATGLPERPWDGKEGVTPSGAPIAPVQTIPRKLLAVPPVPFTPGALKLKIAAATGVTPNAVKWIALAGFLALIPLVVRKR